MQQGWRRRLGDRIIRAPRQQALEPLRIITPPAPTLGRRLESPLILLYGFGSLIAIGTLLLWLPIFNTTGRFAPFLTALFTATSASTNTGLTVVDTATYWNRAGQTVIMVLMQIGGLGFMSTATFLLVILTQRISLANQFIMRDFLGVGHLSGLARLTLQVVAVALVVQVAGFMVFYWRFLPLFGLREAAWQAGFLAISAFNNAGFSILPDSNSLGRFGGEMWVLGTAGALIILGGISYSVLVDLVRYRRFKRFTLDSRLVIVASLSLWVLGGLVIFVSEFANGATLKGLPFTDKLAASLFHSVSARTAGLSTIDFSLTQQ
ncbi:MAG: Trk family potassium uptake protein, partial [Chloroflexi bacterium]|nr:Trk family potassium uptake protein [Chloroflexota bacterium]